MYERMGKSLQADSPVLSSMVGELVDEVRALRDALSDVMGQVDGQQAMSDDSHHEKYDHLVES
jgi:hypothetical protein